MGLFSPTAAPASAVLGSTGQGCSLLDSEIFFGTHGALGRSFLSFLGSVMSGKCPILRLRGLPYSSTEKDIASFFEDFELVATHINLRNGG